MVAFRDDNTTTLKTGNTTCLFLSNEWMLAWEDLQWGAADRDYNDFVVFVESVHPVPEPAVFGIFRLGALMMALPWRCAAVVRMSEAGIRWRVGTNRTRPIPLGLPFCRVISASRSVTVTSPQSRPRQGYG